MKLTNQMAAKALMMLSAAGWGNTPRALTDGDTESAAQQAHVWATALRLIGTTDEELAEAVRTLLVQPGRRFWPSTTEVCDVIREGRSQQVREQLRRVLAAAEDAHALPAPEVVQTDDERRQFLLARMRRSGIEAGHRAVRILHEMGQSTRAERQAVAEFEQELREMAEAEEMAE